jgi:hypothetical protein
MPRIETEIPLSRGFMILVVSVIDLGYKPPREGDLASVGWE